jgi:C-terminal processing protease CtpA/Prc
VLTLIGPLTFSAGVDAAANLKLRANATLVGEPTGGKPNTYGDVRSFTLPNAGLTIYYSSRHFYRFEALGDAPSLEPDLRVPLSAEHYFAGRDPVLEAALRAPRDANTAISRQKP